MFSNSEMMLASTTRREGCPAVSSTVYFTADRTSYLSDIYVIAQAKATKCAVPTLKMFFLSLLFLPLTILRFALSLSSISIIFVINILFAFVTAFDGVLAHVLIAVRNTRFGI